MVQEARQDPLVGTTLEGRFFIERLLGEGGMGRVYVAEELRLKRRCALKVLLPELSHDEDCRDRFLREAQAIAQSEHENVVDIYHLGDDGGGVVFFAMELLSGEDLETRLQDKQNPPHCWQQICQWMVQVAAAMSSVHAAGLIHRDLNALQHLPQQAPRRPRAGQAARLRHRQVQGRRRAHQHRRGDRHPLLHVAGADPRAGSSTTAPISTRSASCSSRPSPAACPSSARPSRSPCSTSTSPRRRCARSPPTSTSRTSSRSSSPTCSPSRPSSACRAWTPSSRCSRTCSRSTPRPRSPARSPAAPTPPPPPPPPPTSAPRRSSPGSSCKRARSQNMLAVQNLCSRVIWLHDGKIVQDGKPADVVSSYLRMSASMLTEQVWNDVTQAPGNHKVRLRKISVRGADRNRPDQLGIDQPCEIEVEYWNQRPQAVLHATLHVYTEQGILAFTTGSAEQAATEYGAMPAGLFRSVCHLPANLLNTGVHRIVLLIVENRSRVTYRLEDALSFEMVELSKRHFGWQGREPGAVRPMLRWTTIQVQAGEPVNMTPLHH